MIYPKDTAKHALSCRRLLNKESENLNEAIFLNGIKTIYNPLNGKQSVYLFWIGAITFAKVAGKQKPLKSITLPIKT